MVTSQWCDQFYLKATNLDYFYCMEIRPCYLGIEFGESHYVFFLVRAVRLLFESVASWHGCGWQPFRPLDKILASIRDRFTRPNFKSCSHRSYTKHGSDGQQVQNFRFRAIGETELPIISQALKPFNVYRLISETTVSYLQKFWIYAKGRYLKWKSTCSCPYGNLI